MGYRKGLSTGGYKHLKPVLYMVVFKSGYFYTTLARNNHEAKTKSNLMQADFGDIVSSYRYDEKH
jgi:hypothetical protein